MKYWLCTLALGSAFAAVAAHAAPMPSPPLKLSEPKPPRTAKFDLRLIAGPSSTASTRRSGMIATRQVMRNGVVGIGLIKSSPKLGPSEWTGRRERGSRKAAVSFELKF